MGPAWLHSHWRYSLNSHLQMSYSSPLALGKVPVSGLFLNMMDWNRNKLSHVCVCELQIEDYLLSPSYQDVRGAEFLAQGANSLTLPFSNILDLYNLPTLHHFSASPPRLWAQKQAIAVSLSFSLFQDLPHPFSLIQPIERITIWSQLCAPRQEFLPKMTKKPNQTTILISLIYSKPWEAWLKYFRHLFQHTSGSLLLFSLFNCVSCHE